VKRKKLTKLLGVILALVMLSGLTMPFASASEVTIEFLNPLGRVEPLDNQPLTERPEWLLDENGKLMERKVVRAITFSNNQASIALAMMLMDEFGRYGEFYPDAGILLVANGSLGNNWGRRSDQEYINMVNVTNSRYTAAGTVGGMTAAVWNARYQSPVAYTGRIDIAIMGVAD
jgi:hypothetical protein